MEPRAQFGAPCAVPLRCGDHQRLHIARVRSHATFEPYRDFIAENPVNCGDLPGLTVSVPGIDLVSYLELALLAFVFTVVCDAVGERFAVGNGDEGLDLRCYWTRIGRKFTGDRVPPILDVIAEAVPKRLVLLDMACELALGHLRRVIGYLTSWGWVGLASA